MKTEKQIKNTETGPVFDRPHATRAQRRGVLKQMPQWKSYKALLATHEDSIEFRNDTREGGKKINVEHQDKQVTYTESQLTPKASSQELLLKEIGYDEKYIKAYMESWWDTTINRRTNIENGEEHRFNKILKNYLKND
jgi:hypothetical protein